MFGEGKETAQAPEFLYRAYSNKHREEKRIFVNKYNEILLNNVLRFYIDFLN